MSYDEDWPDESVERRMEVIRNTIKPMTLTELKKLADELFPVVTDPWSVRFTDFLKTHGDANYFHANTPDGAQIIYCRDSDKGIWYIPGSGIGILQPKGLEALKQITDAL